MKGITIGTYAQWKGRKVTKAELRAITDAEVAAIYKRNYWDKVRGDDLPSGLDFVAFDAAVNSGPARGAKWLQQALGVAADGKIGPKTLAAAEAANAPVAIQAALNARLAFMRSLRTWPIFGKGWSRRVDGVRKAALELAAKPAEAQRKPAQRVSEAKPSRAKETAGTVAGGATGAGLVVAVLAFADDAAQAWRDLWIYVFSFFN